MLSSTFFYAQKLLNSRHQIQQMKYFVLFIFSFGVLSTVQSQDPYEILGLKSNEWIKAAEKLEPFCDLPKTNWLNINEGERVWDLNEQFSFILTGSLDDPKCLENLRTLNQLQYVYPHIDVLYIHQSNATYPATVEDLEIELNRYDIGVKAHFDDTGSIACLPYQSVSQTILVSPQVKIYGELDEWLGIDKLVDLTSAYTNRILDAYNLRPQPFFGKKPSQKYKVPVLQTPMNIAADKDNNRLFVSDYMQHRILILSPQGQLLDYIGSGRGRQSDGDFSKASFNGPRGMAFDEARNTLYVADSKNGRIKAVDLNELTVKTILGNGKLNDSEEGELYGTESPIPYPLDLALDYDRLYISTYNGILKMDLNTQLAELVPNSQNLGPLYGIELNSDGDIVASDANRNAIYLINDKVLTGLTPANAEPGFRNGKKDEIAFNHPKGFILQDDLIYVADQNNNSLRSLNISKLKASTVSGDSLAGYKDGSTNGALFNMPTDITKLGDKYYCTDMGNHVIRVIDEGSNTVSTLSLLEYQSLCYGYKPPVMELNDGPEIKLAKGDSIINISFELLGDYVFDPNGVSYIDITTRKREAAVIKDDDLNDGQITIAIRDSLEKTLEVTIDLNMSLYDSRFPGIPYFKSTSYTFPISIGTETAEIAPIIIEIE